MRGLKKKWSEEIIEQREKRKENRQRKRSLEQEQTQKVRENKKRFSIEEF